jgi:hypothetical protein
MAVGSAGHLTSLFGVEESWALMYNMYPDKWLGIDLIDQEVRTIFWRDRFRH